MVAKEGTDSSRECQETGKDVITLGDITVRSLGAVCLTDTLQDNRSSARNILIPVEFLTRTETPVTGRMHDILPLNTLSFPG